MGIYTEIIIKKEENNRRLEQYADDSLKLDVEMHRLENSVDDAETALLFILNRFGLTVRRVFCQTSIDEMLETLLDPLGMMYEYSEDIPSVGQLGANSIMAFRNDGKAVALFPSLFGYRYYCPSDSSSGFASRSFLEKLKKGCYIFNRPLEERKSVISTFTANVFKSLTAREVFPIIAAALSATVLGYIIPMVSRWIYQDYIPGNGSAADFGLAVIVFLLVSLSRIGLNSVKSLMLSGTKVRVSTKVQSAVMAKTLHLPQAFFTSTDSGKLSRRIYNCGRLSTMVLDIMMDVLLDTVFSVVYLFQMHGFAPILFLPAILFLLLKIVASAIGAVLNAQNEAGIMDVEMKESSLMYSAIRGIQKIKGMGAEKSIYAKWAELYRNTLSLNYKQPFFLKYSTEIIAALSTAATITLLGVTLTNDLSAKDYMTFSASYALIITVVAKLTDMMKNMFQVKSLCENVSPLFTSKNEEPEALEYVHRLGGNVTVDNIWFSYGNAQRGCLKGVTMDIKRGEKVAIVGSSGCGKSTLLKILIGLEIPDDGTVYYDSKQLSSLNIRSLRRCIGSVFQFSKVFPGTIAENVTFGSSGNVSDESIWKAVEKAAMGDYIRKLPLKLDTEISESASSGFSGGQRQRILIARALLGNPNVLILDEATSALDNVTQAEVLDNICNLNATVIMVAHRLSTVVNFDRIFMLEDGIIAEEGSYEELISKNGKFAELVRKQRLQTETG